MLDVKTITDVLSLISGGVDESTTLEYKSGIDTYVLNLSKLLKEAGYKVDFLTNKKTSYMNKICAELNIGLIEIPSLKNPSKQLNVMKEIFKEVCDKYFTDEMVQAVLAVQEAAAK